VIEGRLEILTRPAFTAAGRALLGGLWETGQDGYEALWLGADRPASAAGDLFLLGWMRDGAARARLAIWKPVAGDCLFMLYARASDAGAGETAAFLGAAKAFCRERGIPSLTGPMQFSTWHPYRFITGMGEADFFPGEQRLPAEYHGDFLAAGFSDIAGFQSSWVPDVTDSLRISEAMGVPQRLAAVETKILSGRDLPAMLPEIHRLSLEIFRGNFAFSPIGLGDFLALAAGDKAGESVLIAGSIGGRTAGFAYGYAIGPYAVTAGVPERNTAVLKTLGVLPEHRGIGLGFGLSYLFHKHWLERGCESLIHAYMKTDNRSTGMSNHVAKPFRTYALMKAGV
jgi:GNAT superfamily N-acetyltransferase